MILKVFLPLFKNRYSLFFIGFIGWIVFFDSNNLIDRYFQYKQVHKLENEIKFYREKIKTDNAMLEELLSNPENLEKFAREQYLMKKENEDVFVIE